MNGCGKPLPKEYHQPNKYLLFEQVRSWAEVEESCSDNAWIRAQVENIIGVSNYFQFYKPPLLDEYHRIRKEASTVIHQELAPAIHDFQTKNGLSDAFSYSVRLNLINVVVEYHFAEVRVLPGIIQSIRGRASGMRLDE